MLPRSSRTRTDGGFTLVELMVTVGLLGVVVLALTAIMLSSSHLQSRTVRRAQVQAGSRQALSIITTELREAGADPSYPPLGLVGIVDARAHRIQVRADINGDGSLQTTEPSEDITFIYDDTTHTVARDAGSGPVVMLSNVTGMELTYFDAANTPLTALPLSAADAARVHVIGVTLTSEDRDSHPITLTTRVQLRNL